MKIRPATREDIEAFSPMPNKPTVMAWVGEVDGKVVGIGGFAFFRGRWAAFLDLREGARPHKVALARAAIRCFKEARERGIQYIYAQADPAEKSSIRWLTSLGFEIDERHPTVFRWSKQ